MLPSYRLTAPLFAALLLFLVSCGGQPARDEVRSGLVEQIRAEAPEISDQAATDTANCMLDELYDEVDNSTLQAWAEGGEAGQLENLEDQVDTLEASKECSQAAGEAERAALPVPSMEEVRAGVVKFVPGLIAGATLNQEQSGVVADCILAEVGDDLDDDTKRAWAKGTSEHSADLSSAVNAAVQKCAESITAS